MALTEVTAKHTTKKDSVLFTIRSQGSAKLLSAPMLTKPGLRNQRQFSGFPGGQAAGHFG
jgi:hypothetical protein